MIVAGGRRVVHWIRSILSGCAIIDIINNVVLNRKKSGSQDLKKSTTPAVLVFTFVALVSVIGFSVCAYLTHHRGSVFNANDPLGYYVYVRSIVHDHDIDFANELSFFKHPEYPVGAGVGVVDPKTHRFTNQYSIGFPLVVGPLYLTTTWFAQGWYPKTHLLSKFPWFLDQIIFCGSSIFIGLIGIWLCYRFVSIYFPPDVSLISILIYWLASPAIYYFLREPFLSHLASIFAVSLFLYLWAHKNLNSQLRALLMGITAGVMTMIRQQEVLMIIVPIVSAFSISRMSHQKDLLGKSILFFSLGFLAVFSIQLAAWKVLRGSYLVFSYSSGGSFSNAFAPRIFDVLFSSNHGLFSWHPILVICLFGLLCSSILSPRVKIALLLAFLGQLYITASWSNWWLGHSFGNRAFLGLTPIFVLGLASLLTETNSRRIFLMIPIFVLLIVWNGVLMLGYLSEMIPYQGEFSWVEYVKNLPSLPERILEKLDRL